MRAVIIGSASIGQVSFYTNIIKKNDYIICADGGYNTALKMGIVPDIVIGDMDSVIGEIDIKTIKYPTRKDSTDGEIAVRYALDKDFEEILLLGFIGNRMDHTMTNIFFLKLINEYGKKGMLIDEHNEIYLLTDKITVTGEAGDIISLVPISEDIKGVSTKNLEYPLSSETLYFGNSRGVSNVMQCDECTISLEIGMALVIKSRD